VIAVGDVFDNPPEGATVTVIPLESSGKVGTAESTSLVPPGMPGGPTVTVPGGVSVMTGCAEAVMKTVPGSVSNTEPGGPAGLEGPVPGSVSVITGWAETVMKTAPGSVSDIDPGGPAGRERLAPTIPTLDPELEGG